jgi:hypothetical protein
MGGGNPTFQKQHACKLLRISTGQSRFVAQKREGTRLQIQKGQRRKWNLEPASCVYRGALDVQPERFPMRVFSAVDAISPAINRTRDFLFRPPFQWTTFLKLCLVAAITEGLGTNLRSSANNSHAPSASAGDVIFHFTPEAIAAIVAMSLLLVFVALVIAYFVTRLRFAYFHCLATNTRLIRPGWEMYRPQANRFFQMNIVVGLCFLLMAALMMAPFVPGFVRFFKGLQAGGQPDVALLLSLALPLIPIFLLIVVVAILLDIVLRDWMLPHYALDNATAGQAWAAVWERVTVEKGSFFAYSVLRIIGPIIAFIGLFLILLVPSLVLIGSVAAAEYAIHTAFATATGAVSAIGILLEVFIGALALGFAIVIGISIGGPISTALREYALIFYGSRYAKLGEMMFPSAPPMQPGIPPGLPAD